jgi:hypothetical protein
VSIVAHNFRGKQVSTADSSAVIDNWEFTLPLTVDSEYAMGIQVNARMGPEYPLDVDYNASISLHAVKCRPPPTDPNTAFTLEQPSSMTMIDDLDMSPEDAAYFNNNTPHASPPHQQFQPLQDSTDPDIDPVDPIPGYEVFSNLFAPSIISAQRAKVGTYFYNTYIPGIDTDSPAGMDPNRAHAEFQVSAWYNFELIPRPANDKLPNTLEIHLHGRNYFVINETYASFAGQTLCWANSLPVLVSIESSLNQTLTVHLRPRFDAHNEDSVLDQAIPVAAEDAEIMQARFFFEFTCQDRVKIVYDPDDTQLYEFLSLVPVRQNDKGVVIDRRVDRYITDMQHITGFTHGPTPNEVLGTTYYDDERNLVVCRTTIDFWDTRWLDSTDDILITAGIDGMTFAYDGPGEKPKSTVLLSILPDPMLYPDINPKFTNDMLDPRLFVGNVTFTGAGGPFVTFVLEKGGFRPYSADVKTPSATVQINLMFSLHNLRINYPEPSCTIIVQGMKVEGKTLSYSTSQYINATAFWDGPSQLIVSDTTTTTDSQQPQPQPELLHALEELELSEGSTPTPKVRQKKAGSAQPSTIMENLGWKYPDTSNEGLSVSSDPFDEVSIKIKNPRHHHFQYVLVESQPGMTRFKLKNNEYTTNGEQIVVKCKITSDGGKNRIDLNGGLSVLTRELEIGPIPIKYIEDHREYDVTCSNLKLTSESIQPPPSTPLRDPL